LTEFGETKTTQVLVERTVRDIRNTKDIFAHVAEMERGRRHVAPKFRMSWYRDSQIPDTQIEEGEVAATNAQPLREGWRRVWCSESLFRESAC
jgi:hypothetical protein